MILKLLEGAVIIDELILPSPSGEVEERKVDQARDVLLNTLAALMDDCTRPQVELPENHCTPLDTKLFERREREKANTLADITIQHEQLQNRQISVQECLASLKNTVTLLTKDAVESQTCIPDIVVWLIHKGDRSTFLFFFFSPLK